MSHSVACIIPARYASTRLPGKPLIMAGGLPLIMWTYRRAIASGAFTTVAVATDDTRIRETVEQYGGKAIMTSPNHPSGTDRVHEASKQLSESFVVNLQGDEPLIPFSVLKSFSNECKNLDEQSLLTCAGNATIDDMASPNIVKVVLNHAGDALYFSRSAIPFNRDNKGKGTGYRHIGIYGFSVQSLAMFCRLPKGILEEAEKLEQLRALEHGMRIKCLKNDFVSIGIDTPEDMQHFCDIIQTNGLTPEGNSL
jgi:3-deoxy-manno-octulosonate cytidylyltransferase (CMP-KDO synthetase)